MNRRRILTGLGGLILLSGCIGNDDTPGPNRPTEPPEDREPPIDRPEPKFIQNSAFETGSLSGWEVVVGENGSATINAGVESNTRTENGYVARVDVESVTDTNVFLVQPVEGTAIETLSVRARKRSGSNLQVLSYLGPPSEEEGDSIDTSGLEFGQETESSSDGSDGEFRVVSYTPIERPLTDQWATYEFDVGADAPEAVLAIGVSVPAGQSGSIAIDKVDVSSS